MSGLGVECYYIVYTVIVQCTALKCNTLYSMLTAHYTMYNVQLYTQHSTLHIAHYKEAKWRCDAWEPHPS